MKHFSLTVLLLINLLIATVLVSLINTYVIFYLGAKEVRSHVREELVHSNYVVQSILKNAPQTVQDPRQLTKILANVQQPEELAVYHSHPLLYQIWDKTGTLIVKTPNAPNTPLSNGTTGFSNTYNNNQSWYVFTNQDPSTGVKIMVASLDDHAQKLIGRFLTSAAYLFLFTLVFFGLVSWLILKSGFSYIRKIGFEISNRAANYLEPVNTKKVPIEIRPLVDELNKLFNILRNAIAADNHFLADAAHELKTPLAVLKMQGQVAMKTEDPEKRNAALRQLIKGVDRTTHLTQQLLTLSRLKSSVTLEKQINVDLVKITKDVMLALVPTAITNDIEISFESKEEQALLLGNATSLTLLASNLIDNAIRYTQTGGQVTVQIEKHAAQIIFRVIDNGPGIPNELKQRVFERFFRILGTEKAGSGLGLAIVEQIVLMHDAKIELRDPAEGHGLIVEVTFPT